MTKSKEDDKVVECTDWNEEEKVAIEVLSARFDREKLKELELLKKHHSSIYEHALKTHIHMHTCNKKVIEIPKEVTETMGEKARYYKHYCSRFNISREEILRRKRLVKKPENFEEEKVMYNKRKRGSNRVQEHVTWSNKIAERKDKVKLKDQSPELPDEFKEKILKMDGINIQLVITKKLEDSDCKKGQHRLSMPPTKIICDFLLEREKAHLGRKIGSDSSYIPVMLIQPDLEETDIKLKKWDMPKKNGGGTSVYVLTKPWNDVVTKNGLEAGGIIQVWSFRVGTKLGLAIVVPPKSEE